MSLDEQRDRARDERDLNRWRDYVRDAFGIARAELLGPSSIRESLAYQQQVEELYVRAVFA